MSSAAPMPELNARFERTEGWIGADGAYSAALSAERTLWLFSDTWVGTVRNGSRTNATIINNSIGVQTGNGDNGRLEFVFKQREDGSPDALITPADGRGWFWLQAGIEHRGKLYVFLSQVEKTADPGVFGFRHIGQWLGVISNPYDNPASWNIKQQKLPFAIFTGRRHLAFGAAVLRKGEEIYVYGTDDDLTVPVRNRRLVVAKVPSADLEHFSRWRFYYNGDWQSGSTKLSPLADHVATECSVTYLPAFQRYVLVYNENGLSDRILVRTAADPAGPWSTPSLAYTCPEMKQDARVFCYAAKAHPSEADDDEIVLSYVANSFDFSHAVADARLYWPRFVRLNFRFE
ncbi:MAG TPA: DUF4185 domain-containing protein [Verrucomicrobiae bacterium]|nr:DUF4185 domain-containing protein [Verrucomicrobiae bacterium]